MSIDDVLDDLYEESYYWDTLYDCRFFTEDAERVIYLYECCGYSYWQAILKVLYEVEEEVIYGFSPWDCY